MRTGSNRNAIIVLAMLGTASAGLSGCTGPRPSPVVEAALGLESGETKPFRQGIVPPPEVRPGDDLIGRAANSPGQCIWRREGSTQRLEADCPEGFEL